MELRLPLLTAESASPSEPQHRRPLSFYLLLSRDRIFLGSRQKGRRAFIGRAGKYNCITISVTNDTDFIVEHTLRPQCDLYFHPTLGDQPSQCLKPMLK